MLRLVVLLLVGLITVPTMATARDLIANKDTLRQELASALTELDALEASLAKSAAALQGKLQPEPMLANVRDKLATSQRLLAKGKQEANGLRVDGAALRGALSSAQALVAELQNQLRSVELDANSRGKIERSITSLLSKFADLDKLVVEDSPPM